MGVSYWWLTDVLQVSYRRLIGDSKEVLQLSLRRLPRRLTGVLLVSYRRLVRCLTVVSLEASKTSYRRLTGVLQTSYLVTTYFRGREGGTMGQQSRGKITHRNMDAEKASP